MVWDSGRECMRRLYLGEEGFLKGRILRFSFLVCYVGLSKVLETRLECTNF
jgi:hypothetical protein